MDTQKLCQNCGMPLAADAPRGLCPACLMKAALATGTVPGEDARQFTPPTVEELRPKFPQLEILELIGHGGMGAVYKARQRELDRVVALKILPPGIGDDPAFAERFAREAKALAKLNHPGIITIHDFGRADGLYFFVMEYVDGVNLGQLLGHGRIAPREALAVVPQICDALQYAHDQGIVHRDIKPQNILLDRRGRVKVADFGLAKIVGNEGRAGSPLPAGGDLPTGAGAHGVTHPTSDLTDASKVMGTPQYMSPEQIRAPGEVDHRADIYALGVVFYQMLTGELPAKKIEPPSAKVKIDVRLDEVVLRALEKKPELRYQQASVLKTEVETIAATLGNRPSGAEIQQNSPRFPRTAIVGAIWATLFIPFLFTCQINPQASGTIGFNGEVHGPWWVWPFALMALTVFAAPAGTTVLGWVAVSQIRQSAGRLQGLWLAALDGLLFPLLGLDLFIAGVWLGMIKTIASWRNLHGSLFVNLWDASLFLALLVMVLGAVDFLIAHRVWCWLNRSPDAARSPGRTLSQALFTGVLSLGALLGLAAALIFSFRNVDDVRQPFVNDPNVVGAWNTVDFVEEPGAFQPEKQNWGGDLPVFQNFRVLADGRTSYRWLTWTKGLFINRGEKTAAHYEIRSFNHTNYLFIEWKNGDYILFHSKPWYYVLREVPDTNFFIGQIQCPFGDAIEIKSVERTASRITVRGTYNLVSADQAELAFHLTTTNAVAVPINPEQRTNITRGRGDFELTHTHLVPGMPHVSLYANGRPFAGVYFGTADEAEQARKLNLDDYQSPQPATESEAFLQQQIKLAKAGNFWAKFQLWQGFSQGEVPVFDSQGHRLGKNEVTKAHAEADKWLSELVQGAYLAKFEPINGFNPHTPKEMLDRFSEQCRLFSGRTNLGGASFFRTTIQDGKLIGSFLTEWPEKFKSAVENSANFKLISLEPVTPKQFVRHEASPQESLPESRDSGGQNWVNWNNGQNIGSFYAVAGTSNETVAVGIDGRIATRNNQTGIWKIQTFTGDPDFRAIVYANGQYVVVREHGSIMTSPDGINWTPRISPTTANLLGLFWDGHQYLAGGDDGTILASPDGVTWTKRPFNDRISIYSFSYSGSLYVAVGNDGLLTSTDSVSWKRSSSRWAGAAIPFTASTWTGTEFLACGLGLDQFPTIYTCADGNSWVPRDVTVTNSLRAAITVHGAIYLAGDSVIKKSTDGGTTWQDTFVNPDHDNKLFMGLTYNGHELIAAGFNHNVWALPLATSH